MKITRKVDKDGTIHYKNKNGRLHREDGPAYEETSGYKSWLIKGKWHREDGPARIFTDGYEMYYLNDKKYSKAQWENEVAKLKLKRIKDL